MDHRAHGLPHTSPLVWIGHILLPVSIGGSTHPRAVCYATTIATEANTMDAERSDVVSRATSSGWISIGLHISIELVAYPIHGCQYTGVVLCGAT